MHQLWQDIRYGVRGLLKRPGFAAIVIVTLALGIGANTVVFSVINAVLLRSLPFKDPETLILVWGDIREKTSLKGRNQVSATDVADFRSQNTVFEDVVTYSGWYPVLSEAGEAERVPGIQVGDGFFRVMKGIPILGRVFTPEEQEDGKDFVIVLGYGLWQRRFGGDPNVVGKKILFNARPYTVVGVMGPDFHPLPSTLVDPEGQFYRPVAEAYDESQRSGRHLRAIARLKPGVTLENAQSEMTVIAQRLERDHPLHNKGYGIHLVPITEDTIGLIGKALLIAFGAVVFVLLIACANVANLLLARASARQKEITIRAAIGAGRMRLLRQLLTESMLLAVFGGAFGLLLATWGTSVVERLGSHINPTFNNIHIDSLTLLFTAGVAIATSLIFGLAPAWQVSRPNLAETLKEGGRSSGGSAGHNRLRSGLVIFEVAMTLVLLVGAGLLIRTVARLSKVDKGFNAENVLAMNLGLPSAKYPKPENSIEFFKQAIERIALVPGVKAVGITSVLPLSNNFDGRSLVVEDHPRPEGEEMSGDLYVATPGYLRAMEISLLKGRPITDQDTKDTPQIALINQTMATQLWPNDDPVGKRIKFPGNEKNPQPWRTVIGIVNDVSQYSLDHKPPMQIYLPHAQFPNSFVTFVIKTTGDPASYTAAVRNQILSVDRDQAVFKITTLEELTGESILLRRFFMMLLSAFAVTALVLAAVGIYGVMSYVVTQRTHEIGIRMALGAQLRDVRKMVLHGGMKLTVLGIAIGLAGSFALTRLVSSLLFEVSTTDATTFSAMSVALMFIALMGCYLPARRATRVDPLEALRGE